MVLCPKMNDQFGFENKQIIISEAKNVLATPTITTSHTSEILHNLHQKYSDIPNTKQQIINCMSKQQIIVVFGLKTCRTITLMNKLFRKLLIT